MTDKITMVLALRRLMGSPDRGQVLQPSVTCVMTGGTGRRRCTSTSNPRWGDGELPVWKGAGAQITRNCRSLPTDEARGTCVWGKRYRV